MSYFWPILWILFIFNDRISLQIWSSSLFTCLHTSTTNPLHTYYGRDSEEHVTLCLFCFHLIITSLQLMLVAKSSIQVLWVPQLSSSKSSLQLFYHWNMSEKGNAQRIKKTTIIPLTETILCEKLKALNPYQNKYFVCLSEFKHFDIV